MEQEVKRIWREKEEIPHESCGFPFTLFCLQLRESESFTASDSLQGWKYSRKNVPQRMRSR